MVVRRRAVAGRSGRVAVGVGHAGEAEHAVGDVLHGRGQGLGVGGAGEGDDERDGGDRELQPAGDEGAPPGGRKPDNA